jgi:hypothetical protein
MTNKGDELDWMPEKELRDQLFFAEAQEIAAGVLAGKNIRKEIRDDKKFMRQVAREIAEHVLKDTANDE